MRQGARGQRVDIKDSDVRAVLDAAKNPHVSAALTHFDSMINTRTLIDRGRAASMYQDDAVYAGVVQFFKSAIHSVAVTGMVAFVVSPPLGGGGGGRIREEAAVYIPPAGVKGPNDQAVPLDLPQEAASEDGGSVDGSELGDSLDSDIGGGVRIPVCIPIDDIHNIGFVRHLTRRGMQRYYTANVGSGVEVDPECEVHLLGASADLEPDSTGDLGSFVSRIVDYVRIHSVVLPTQVGAIVESGQPSVLVGLTSAPHSVVAARDATASLSRRIRQKEAIDKTTDELRENAARLGGVRDIINSMNMTHRLGLRGKVRDRTIFLPAGTTATAAPAPTMPQSMETTEHIVRSAICSVLGLPLSLVFDSTLSRSERVSSQADPNRDRAMWDKLAAYVDVLENVIHRAMCICNEAGGVSAEECCSLTLKLFPTVSVADIQYLRESGAITHVEAAKAAMNVVGIDVDDPAGDRSVLPAQDMLLALFDRGMVKPEYVTRCLAKINNIPPGETLTIERLPEPEGSDAGSPEKPAAGAQAEGGASQKAKKRGRDE